MYSVRCACMRLCFVLVCFHLGMAADAWARHGELPNRIPEAPPYIIAEAKLNPPPYEHQWTTINNPALCAGCHGRIFKEWNGSMMANAWRDPVWQAAFLLIARLTATDGNCDVPDPPDGSARATLNPFASGDCTSTFDLGNSKHTTRGSGSLLDEFCSRCHMPTNYIDQFALENVQIDILTGQEHGMANPRFDPTSDNGTGVAFATDKKNIRNTLSGQQGISCAFCHTQVGSRYTPYHVYSKNGLEYSPMLGEGQGDEGAYFETPDDQHASLGYGIGSGAFVVSPDAIISPKRFGPLTTKDHTDQKDSYVSEVFQDEMHYQQADHTFHKGDYHALFERTEHCGACHDVTNPMPIKNPLGKWVGGFTMERTYSEWAKSRYADRPGNTNYDSRYKRDCQTCHMQQDYGYAGTGRALYDEGKAAPPLQGVVGLEGPLREVYYSHHFIGGNAYMPGLIGEAARGYEISPYPELSTYSFSSASKSSIYHNAYFITRDSGTKSQHGRLAWDRLRNVVTLEMDAPEIVQAGNRVSVPLTVVNEGSGHNFPTGFPEGRNAWITIRAFDLESGDELQIYDSVWQRLSKGVGYLTVDEMDDPNFPECDWKLPAGSPDPYAYQFRAIASLGDGCPTLALPYATPLNLVTNNEGMPIDDKGKVIDRNNPLQFPQYRDLDGDGDVYDDSFLVDTRLRPMPNSEATVKLDRYQIEIPSTVRGPVVVSAAVYYQSLEAMAALKFLGNLADIDLDFNLEPGVLKGLDDGRVSHVEPAVIEGAPPVPVVVKTHVLQIEGHQDKTPPKIMTYPENGAVQVYRDAVVKAIFSEPVKNINSSTYTLTDANGETVTAFVEQIGDGTWGLFPHQVFLQTGRKYTAKLAAPVCDWNDNCISEDISWSFTITDSEGGGLGDTRIPLGFHGKRPVITKK